MLIAPLAPEHAKDAARLHILGQPGTFLTALGPDVLAVLYRALPQTPGGFGYAAVEVPGSAGMETRPLPFAAGSARPIPQPSREDAPSGTARPIPQPSREGAPSGSARPIPQPSREDAPSGSARPVLIGYVSATTSVGGLFATLATHHLAEFLPPLLRRYARDPRLALRSVQSALYPLLAREPSAEPSADLLSIMVEPAQRSHGTGALLVEALFQASRNRGLAAVTVTVDAANPGAQRFYARHGFTHDHPIRLNGRPMLVLRRRL